MGFAVDSATGLKLLEAGLPKDRIALLAIPMTPLQIILPFVISKYTTGPHPMNVYLKAMPVRLLFGFVFAFLVWITPSFQAEDGSFPYIYYAGILVIYAIHQITVYSMFVAVMAFFARISDPAVGGTYMTLLNTVTNLGGNWPATVALWLLDPLTSKSCSGTPLSNDCSNSALEETCKAEGGLCLTLVDGYYVETVACVAIGFLWLLWGKQRILRLQAAPLSDWKIANRNGRKD